MRSPAYGTSPISTQPGILKRLSGCQPGVWPHPPDASGRCLLAFLDFEYTAILCQSGGRFAADRPWRNPLAVLSPMAPDQWRRPLTQGAPMVPNDSARGPRLPSSPDHRRNIADSRLAAGGLPEVCSPFRILFSAAIYPIRPLRRLHPSFFAVLPRILTRSGEVDGCPQLEI
jgi:hypothetical protein